MLHGLFFQGIILLVINGLILRFISYRVEICLMDGSVFLHIEPLFIFVKFFRLETSYLCLWTLIFGWWHSF